jgi:hypothetical protein
MRLNYTLMMIVIQALTFMIMPIIIEALELARPGETHTRDPCEPP